MMSQQAVFDTTVRAQAADPWPLSHVRTVTVAASNLIRIAGVLAAFARVPTLPYAELWEASIVVSLVTERESRESDPFGMPHWRQTDSVWL